MRVMLGDVRINKSLLTNYRPDYEDGQYLIVFENMLKQRQISYKTAKDRDTDLEKLDNLTNKK